MGFQKRLHPHAQLAVDTRGVQKSPPLRGIFIDGLKKHLFHVVSR
jgi:hypothetical protein